MEIVTRNLSDLIPYINNARTHEDQQITQIASSIREFGFTNPVLIDPDNSIIAGHCRVLAAKKLNIDKIPCIVLKDLSDAQKKAYIIADNKLAINSAWDFERLKVEIDGLQDLNFDLDLLGFDSDELDDIFSGEDFENSEDEDNPYTRKIISPVYAPKGEKPKLEDLYSKEKTDLLISEIEKSRLPEEDKSFLIASAERHTVFNFDKIADYYAHSDKEVQNLMENSALVIIDFNKAIDLGFVKLSNEVMEQYKKDYEKAENEQ